MAAGAVVRLEERVGEAAVDPEAEASGEPSEVLVKSSLATVESAGAASVAWTAWELPAEPKVDGLPWRAQAPLASATSPTTSTIAVSLVTDLFWRFTWFVSLSDGRVVAIGIIGRLPSRS